MMPTKEQLSELNAVDEIKNEINYLFNQYESNEIQEQLIDTTLKWYRFGLVKGFKIKANLENSPDSEFYKIYFNKINAMR